MAAYFKTSGTKRRGRPKTSIVTTLRRDLKRVHTTLKLNLRNIKDLNEMREIANNRSEWKYTTAMICRAAQAEKSVDDSADGP